MKEIKVSVTYLASFKADVGKIRKYLERNGWTEYDKWSRYGCLMKKGSLKLAVLTSEEPVDFRLRMSEFIHELSKFEGISPIDLINDLENEE